MLPGMLEYIYSAYLGTPQFARVVYLVMLLMVFFFIFRLWAWNKRKKQIASTVESLKAINDGMDPVARRKAMKDEVGKTDWLEKPFHEWWEQTRVEGGRITNDIQSGEFLGSEALAPPECAYADSFPGLFTALGILGTFLGIVYGLSGLDLEVSDTQELVQGISKLVGGLKGAFGTSIAGLVLSGLATLLLVSFENSFEEQRLELIRWLDSIVDRTTPQSRLGKLLRFQQDAAASAEIRAERSLAILERLAGLTEKLLKTAVEQNWRIQKQQENLGQIQETSARGYDELRQLNHDLGDVMERTIQNSGLVEAMQNMADTIAQTQSEGVGQIVEQFSEQMGTHFGDNFNALGESIDAMVGANQEYRESMGSVVRQLHVGMDSQKEAAAAMSSTVGEARAAVAEMSGALANLSASAGALDGASEGARELLHAQVTHTDRVLAALSAQREVWGEQMESLHGLRSAIDALRDWHERVRNELSEQLSRWHQSLEVQVGLTEDLKHERQNTRGLIESLKRAAAAFSGVSNILARTSTNLQGHMQTTSTTNQAAAEELARASAGLGELRSALEGSIAAFQSTAEVLASSGPQVVTALQGLKQAVEGQAMVAEQGQRLATAISQSVDKQELLYGSFQRAESLMTRIGSTAENLDGSSKNLERSIESLAAIPSALSSIARNLSETGERLSSRDREAARTWELVTTDLRSTTTDLTKGMEAYSKKMNDATKRTWVEFDRAMAKATKDLKSAISSLHHVVEDMSETFEELA